jgi:hypothetical protein
MTFERMRELFGVAHTLDAKRMHIGEEEIPVPQSLAIMVPPEEEEDPVP